MKIEIGKLYRNSLGEEVYIKSVNGLATTIYPYMDGANNKYDINGNHESNISLNLISLVLEEDNVGELERLQANRESDYGTLKDHAESVDVIMEALRDINCKKNKSDITDWPKGFETVMFYLASKMVRMSTNPEHEDSALDLSNYAKLWLEQGIRNER